MDNQTNVGALATRFFDNDCGFGFLINQPGAEPVVYLNRTLLGDDPSGPMFQQVYDTLLNYYQSLSIWEFVFPFRRFYEELEAQPDQETQIIILGQFRRSEAHCKVCEARIQGYRLIG